MLSIIIPVYNEEKAIKKNLSSLPYTDKNEIIVVDGGSFDRTIEFAKEYSVKVIPCLKNRALQMNKGAKEASGDIFLFLHADCLLEDGCLQAIESSLRDGCVGGCLNQSINSAHLIYRFIEASGNIRARLFKIFYGDQAIFVRRDVFFKLGGFSNDNLFEDAIFSKRLKHQGKVIVLAKKVYASARRWETQGITKTTLINWLLTLGFLLGIPCNILKRVYQDIR